MTFSNQLSAAKPVNTSWTTAGATLTLLFVLCLVPRAMMALRLDSLCPDGTFYLDKVQRLEAGLAKRANDAYDLNVYPLVLKVFHDTGLTLETAARVWGVLAASLAVLPLFGWIRRAFDSRLAVLAGVLYAAHPKLIEWSPHAVRESTFWLLFCLSLYCLWRAVTEVRPAWFAAAGTTTFLAVNTRFEGWFLLIPLVCWCGWRLWGLRQCRMNLVRGIGVFGLCYPLVMAVLVSSHGFDRWDWGNFQRLEMVTQWVQEQWPTGQPAQPAAKAKKSTAQTRAARADTPGPLTATPAVAQAKLVGPPRSTASTVLDKWARAYSPIYGALALLGFIRWWRFWLRRDNLPYLLLAIATFVAMWVHASKVTESSTRYVLPVVIVSLPCATLGLLPLCRWAAWFAGWLAPRRAVAPFAAAAATLAVVFFAGAADALSSRTSDSVKRELGCWLRHRYGPNRVVVGSRSLKLAAHYAQARFHLLPPGSARLSSARLKDKVAKWNPEIMLLQRNRMAEAWTSRLVQQAKTLGMATVAPRHLPTSCRGQVVVLVRNHGAKQSANVRSSNSPAWRRSMRPPRSGLPKCTSPGLSPANGITTVRHGAGFPSAVSSGASGRKQSRP